MEVFYGGGSQMGFILGAEESQMELSVWAVVAWSGRTEGPKLVACCCFLLLCCFGELLLEDFTATKGFSGSGSHMGFVLGYEGNSGEL